MVAVLMAYPIKLRVKRVNAFFGFTVLIGICCLLSSFTIVDEACLSGTFCLTKYIYRFSIMVILFLINLAYQIFHFVDWQYSHQLHFRSLSFKYQKPWFCILSRSKFDWKHSTPLVDSIFYLHRFVWIYWIHTCHIYCSLFYYTTTINQWKNESPKPLINGKKYTHDISRKLGYSQFLMISTYFFHNFYNSIKINQKNLDCINHQNSKTLNLTDLVK